MEEYSGSGGNNKTTVLTKRKETEQQLAGATSQHGVDLYRGEEQRHQKEAMKQGGSEFRRQIIKKMKVVPALKKKSINSLLDLL